MTKQDIIEGLGKMGIVGGDNIFVISSLSRFGSVDGGAQTVVDAIKYVINDGTVVMPSFNFSIFKSDKPTLDVENTPSEQGAISECFRKQQDVLRTTNLFHPVCHMGKLSAKLKSCNMVDTWGENSVYGFMLKENFKVVMLGTDFYSCPIFHFCEQRNNVPYREMATYNGVVITGGLPHPVVCRRLRRKYGDSDNNKIYGNFPTREVKIGNSICRSFDVATLVGYLDAQLSHNPSFLFSENELLSFMPTMDTFNMTDAINVLFKEKRDIVSQGFKNALDYISNFIPLRYHTWKSGEQVETWTIPEGDIDTMYVGEFTVKGFSSDTIIFPIHLDHDAMANDNLSGVVVAIELALRLLRTTDLQYTYKFLFVPETIGTMAYMSRFTPKLLFGVVIDSVGTNNKIIATKTKFNHKINDYLECDTNDFLSNAHLWSGNDERVLEGWGVPAIQFSRSPFREYHTTRDVPEIIERAKLDETLDEIYNFILRVERDFVPIPTYKGIPCLSKVNLWELDLGIEKIYHLIGYKLSIAQIAKCIDMPFKYVYDFVIKMEKAGYIKR